MTNSEFKNFTYLPPSLTVIRSLVDQCFGSKDKPTDSSLNCDNDENCNPNLNLDLSSERSTQGVDCRPLRDSLMTQHNATIEGDRDLSSRSNSDWTDDLPSADDCSIVNRQQIKYTDFNWQFAQIQITGFFTHKNNKDKTEIKQRIAQRCFGDEIDQKSYPGQVIKFLGKLTEELRRYFPRDAWTSDQTQYNPMKLGIILQHGEYVYTSTLGCQSVMYPVLEDIQFSTEVELSGPHPIKSQHGNRALNFVLIASSGLVQYLQAAQVARPSMRLGDEIKDQGTACRSQCDLKLLCQWTLESLERMYGPMKNYDILLICRKFNTTYSDPAIRALNPILVNVPPNQQSLLLPSTSTANGYIYNSTSTVNSEADTDDDPQLPLNFSAPMVSPIARHSASSHPRNRDNSFSAEKIVLMQPYVDGFEYFKTKFRERFPGMSKMSDVKNNIRMNSSF